MQSASSVVCLVVAACACLLSLASSSTPSGIAQASRPRHTLLDLVRAAAALPPQERRYNKNLQQEGPSYISVSQAQQPSYHQYTKKFGLTPHRPPHSPFNLSPPLSRTQHAMSEFVVPLEPSLALEGRESDMWSKRGGTNDSLVPSEGMEGEELLNSLTAGVPSFPTNFLRHTRSNSRAYDVPQIECPPAADQMERFPCPSPDRTGRYRCIDDHVLCDGFFDCPDGKDEDREQCMFYKTTKAHLDVVADAIIRFIRGRK